MQEQRPTTMCVNFAVCAGFAGFFLANGVKVEERVGWGGQLMFEDSCGNEARYYTKSRVSTLQTTDVQALVNGQCPAGFQQFYCEEGQNNCGARAGGGSTDGFDYCQNNFACPCSLLPTSTACCYCSCCVAVQSALPVLGNGYCRVQAPSTGLEEKDPGWTTYKECIDLASCKHECREGCAGIAWTATPAADYNFDECYQQRKPRCVVYMGTVPATTSATNMGPDQDYTCYQGPGGAAFNTIG
jgi:hypothetical protein